MKKITLYLLTLVFITACTGPEGPMGPEGPPGEGSGVIGQTFEYEDIKFDYEPDFNMFSTLIDVPDEIEVLESDAILVYRLEIDNGAETFSLIPQNFFLDEGTIQYVYNHTPSDIELIIDGDFDLSNLGTEFTDNQIFRFVVVPADFANDPTINIESFSELIDSGIEFKEF